MISTEGRRRHALCIGVNAYPLLGKFQQLQGCVNDAKTVADLLQRRFGFPKKHVHLLLDEEATQQGIRNALGHLAGAVTTDDLVVVYFAGHGSQMTDREGDEPDGLDETIMPHDSGRRDHPNRDITDDEIHAWLQAVTAKTSYVTMLFDCCHSGTITRDPFGEQARYVEADTRPVEELPVSPIEGPVTRGLDRGPSGWLPMGDKFVLIAGCRDEELSYEYTQGEIPHGALTYFMTRELATSPSAMTYRQLFARVAPQVTALNGRQHPQMEGALDRVLFGVEEVVPLTGVRVAERSGTEVELAAGAAHGLTVGATWSVHAEGATDAKAPIGTLTITNVEAVTASATLTEEEEAGRVQANCWAVQEAVDQDLRLTVSVAGPAEVEEDLDALRKNVADSAFLVLTPDEADAEVRLYVVPARDEAAPPVPQLGTVATPLWVAVGRDGRLLAPPHAIDEPAALGTTVSNLNRICKYRRVLSIDDRSPDNPLAGKIEMVLHRKRPGSTWEEAVSDGTSGLAVFNAGQAGDKHAEGDRFGVTVTNHSERSVYISLLYLGCDYEVSTPLYPYTTGKQQPLEPGDTLSIGMAPKDPQFMLTFPERYPFAPEPGERAIEGLDTLKLFVTSQQADFSALAQGGMRSAAAGGPLEQLLTMASEGQSTRAFQVVRPEPQDAWTTVTQSYLLRKVLASTDLQAEGAATLGDVAIHTRGLAGRVRELAPPAARTRSVDDPPAQGAQRRGVQEALRAEHIAAAYGIGIQPDLQASRSADVAEPLIELEAPDPGPGQGQFVLYTDEAGVMSWHTALPAPPTRSLTQRRRYRLEQRVRPLPPDESDGDGQPGSRGLVGSFIRDKLLEVLVFPLVDPLIGKVGDYFAGRWEARKRPYRYRTFTPDNYQQYEASPVDADRWASLQQGRALLLVHGTFSQAHTGFGGFAPATVAALHKRYGGRVFAFDHFTLSDDPVQNIDWFVRHLPEAADLDLDIICHSRGGLVSRVLAERQSAVSLGSRTVRVGKIVFVASPNAGTALADPDHMGDLVDAYTNLFSLIPDNPVTEVLEGVVTVVKQMAVGALGGLDGLRAMQPTGDFLQQLNGHAGAVETRYFALGANYEPTQHGLRDYAKNWLMDAVFGQENDLVVPTSSVYEVPGVSRFAVEERTLFSTRDGIAHSGFFGNATACNEIMRWLSS